MTSKRRPPKKHIALMLRTCASDMTAYHGFVWPESGFVAAPDWNPRPVCGGGLHGLLWGEGDAQRLSWEPPAKWLVCEVDAREIVELVRKVKVPRAWVVCCGSREEATQYLIERAPGRVIPGVVATAGDHGTATAGYRGTATAGVDGTATAGYRGTATAGDHGTATAGVDGTATAGDRGTATAGVHGTATARVDGTATAGDRGTATAGVHGTATAGVDGTATAGVDGTATAGDRGTATAGYHGTATAGVDGTATAGHRGTATAGDHGTATAGVHGTATAGYHGTLVIRWYDGARYRVSIGCVGEGVDAGTAYRCDADGTLKKVEKA